MLVVFDAADFFGDAFPPLAPDVAGAVVLAQLLTFDLAAQDALQRGGKENELEFINGHIVKLRMNTGLRLR